MSSLENNIYEFRNQAGDSTPRGLSNFPNWADMLIGAGGKPNVRPSDIDLTYHHRPFKSYQWEGALIGEFKPAGYGDLGYAQSGILEWTGKQANSYGIYIEDREWDLRTKTKYDDEQMTTPYRMTVYKDGKTLTYYRSLAQLNEAIGNWWTSGVFNLKEVGSVD